MMCSTSDGNETLRVRLKEDKDGENEGVKVLGLTVFIDGEVKVGAS